MIKSEVRNAVALLGYFSDPAFCAKLVADAVARLGVLDIVVNNAARRQTEASILDDSNDQFAGTTRPNNYAPIWVIKAALPHLKLVR